MLDDDQVFGDIYQIGRDVHTGVGEVPGRRLHHGSHIIISGGGHV